MNPRTFNPFVQNVELGRFEGRVREEHTFDVDLDGAHLKNNQALWVFAHGMACIRPTTSTHMPAVSPGYTREDGVSQLYPGRRFHVPRGASLAGPAGPDPPGTCQGNPARSNFRGTCQGNPARPFRGEAEGGGGVRGTAGLITRTTTTRRRGLAMPCTNLKGLKFVASGGAGNVRELGREITRPTPHYSGSGP
jgi:hypothetical protein